VIDAAKAVSGPIGMPQPRTGCHRAISVVEPVGPTARSSAAPGLAFVTLDVIKEASRDEKVHHLALLVGVPLPRLDAPGLDPGDARARGRRSGAAIGATATDVVRRSRFVTVSLRDLLPRHPWHLATTFVSDCWLLTVALWRQLRDREDNVGVFRGISFDAGADDDPHAAARRAAYTALVSLTPNTYVIGIDREHNNMLVHELVAGSREDSRERVLGTL